MVAPRDELCTSLYNSAGPHRMAHVSPQEHQVKGDVFSFPSVDYEKYYTFYVRSKINSYCGTTQLWSEWSVPVVWGSNSTSKGRSWGLWQAGLGHGGA